jgi:hypothetical protein
MMGALVLAALCLALAPAPTALAQPPVLYGITAQGIFFDSSGPQEVQSIDSWIGDPAKRMSLVETFVDIEWPTAASTVPIELTTIWNTGKVPFINLAVGHVTPGRTVQQIAQGQIDNQIRTWADAYRGWATNGRRAFIAPLQEMNGYWVAYGKDPANFKLAYARIRAIFAQRGVAPSTVRWVFAPNGWSEPGHEFELYYPGNATVDVLAFSSYNFGACVWSGPAWNTFATVFKPFLDRMRVMAPSKPIFIAQTGSVSVGGDKNAWLDDTYTQLAAYPGVRAILYYHRLSREGLPCDPVEWRFFAPASGVVFPGLRNAVLRSPAFGHWPASSSQWATVAFAPGPGGNTFEDVEPAHPFSGVGNVWYYDAVQAVAAAGVTGGCSTAPLRYCPEGLVTRGQMAVFLLKAKYGSGFTPSPPRGIFADVPPGYWAAAWIERLAAEGITGGCGGGRYCPEALVTRAQMAIFLLKALHGAGYRPPAAAGMFGDVPPAHWAGAWIEQLVRERIASGCGGGNFCPDGAVTRAQMAVFLVGAFGL